MLLIRKLLSLFCQHFLDDFTAEELDYCINNAYDSKFDTPAIAPLVKLDGQYNLELFHGSTIAFKDMALSILPYFMTTAAKNMVGEQNRHFNSGHLVILGKLLWQGLRMFLALRLSSFIQGWCQQGQELQMTTQTGDNTHVIAIDGNFDDAQNQREAYV